jgi:hypothetical protein
LQDLRCGRLLLQRFRKFGCTLGKFGGALPQLVEQPRVLDGDDRLGGKTFHQFDLSIRKGSNLVAEQTNCSDQFLVLQHRNNKKRPYATKFDGFDVRRAAFVHVLPFGCKIGRVDH